MKILILGNNGQLGKTLVKELSSKFTNTLSLSRSELDFNDSEFEDKLLNIDFDILINAAALHNLSEAEKNPFDAFMINSFIPQKIAKVCELKKSILFHFSSDYVFSGKNSNPYFEHSDTSPLNIYGHSKVIGEHLISSTFDNYYIFRISSLFSSYKTSNKIGFIDAIIKKAREEQRIEVVSDQMMSPTSSNLVAKTIDFFITNNPPFGTYHLRNQEILSWYDYCLDILNYLKIDIETIPKKYDQLKSDVKRPIYSVMNIDKIESVLGSKIDSYKKDLYLYLDKKIDL